MSIASIKPLLARRGLDRGRLPWFTCCRSIAVSRAERRERLCCSASHNSKPRRVTSITAAHQHVRRDRKRKTERTEMRSRARMGALLVEAHCLWPGLLTIVREGRVRCLLVSI